VSETKPSIPAPVRPLELVQAVSRGELVVVEATPDWRGALRGRALAAAFAAAAFLACVYVAFFTADQYASEAQIVVRGANAGSFGAQLQMLGFTRSSDETHIVAAYLESSDIVADLEKRIDLKAIYARPEADLLSRFPAPFMESGSEALLRHLKRWTSVTTDEASGITLLRAYAFRAEDAFTVARAMIESAEQLVNAINQRAHQDKMAYAKAYLEKAQLDVQRAEREMTEFRNATGTVDLGRESTAALDMIGKMNLELAEMETGLRQQLAVTPNNPALASTRQRIASYKAEIDRLRAKVVGDAKAMSSNLGRFERLSLQRVIVARALEAAQGEFEKARQEAQTQQFYIVRVVEPRRADIAEYPRRLLWIALILIGAGMLYKTIAALIGVVREHRV
jgi:capsular polysaccharide transport system permease protein